jgi:hypothetical protein
MNQEHYASSPTFTYEAVGVVHGLFLL